MRFYLDTEFNGHGGELISLALVSEWVQVPDGARLGEKQTFEWYGARRIRNAPVPWVAEHVYPVIRTHFLSSNRFRSDFQEFMARYCEPEIICDWHADAEHFCALLEGEDYGSSMDYPCTIRILKTPPGVPISDTPHNALEDARALRDWHDSFRKAAQ